MHKSIKVTKVLDFNITPLTNGLNLVRSRWRGSDKHESAILSFENLKWLDRMTTPEAMKKLRSVIKVGEYKNPANLDKTQIEAYPVIIYCDPNDYVKFRLSSHMEESRGSYFEEYHKDYDVEPREGYTIIYYCSYDHTIYDIDGNLLNNQHVFSITEDRYRIYAIAAQKKEFSEFMEVVPDRFGSEISYVRGNGRTLYLRFKMTPDEYRKFIMEVPSYERFEKFMTYKVGEERFKTLLMPESDDDVAY